MKNLKKAAVLAVFAVMAVAVSGMAGGINQAHAQNNFYVAITDNAFSNTFVTLPLNTTVTWTNTGLNSHSVIADNGAFASGVLSPGQNYTYTFNTPGTFTYHDQFYGGVNGSGMSATIVVQQGENGNGGSPICSPSTQNVNINAQASFTATGGNGSYTWTAQNASPSFGNGSYFTTSFPVGGTQTVTVSSNGFTSQCTVNVNGFNNNGGGTNTNYGAPVCTPSSQNGSVFSPVTFSASGGNGTYTWSSPSLNIPNPNGPTFTATFNTPGTYTLTLASNGYTTQCSANILGQVLGASTVNTGAGDDALVATIVGLFAAAAGYFVISRKYLKV